MKDHVYSGVVGCVLFAVMLILKACGIGNPYVDLGGGYMLVQEDKDCRYITGEIPPDGVVPPNVISYDYDGRFIVAKQKPMGNEDSRFDDIYYSMGEDTVYYWLIVKDDERWFGPLVRDNYVWLRDVYEVSSDL